MRRRSMTPRSAATPPTLPGTSGDEVRASILLVDDDLLNLYAMAESLRSLGHDLVTASSGEQALRHLLERDFALILMDVRMQGLDGYQTAELIRSRERCSYVPIIFVTGVNMDEGHVFRGYSAGAVDYIFKPIDPLILKSKVSVFVELYRKSEEIKRQAAQEAALMQENFRVRMEKLRLDEALRQRDEQYRLIIRALPIALYAAVLDGGVKRDFISDNIEAITGFPAAAFAADDGLWLSRVHWEDLDRVTAAIRALPESGSANIEYRWLRADGAERYFLDQALVLPAQGTRPREVVGTWLDITDRRMLESQLHRAQRLEAIGRLTGGIAHDFNNMLSIVIGNLDLLSRGLGHADARRQAELALRGATRCADLTRRLLTFARQQPLDSKLINLESFISTTAGILDGTLGQSITVDFRSAPGLPSVAADPAQLEAAVFNLIFNARDAMPNGGKLTIELSLVDWASFSLRPADCAAGDYVRLAVSDTGTGMSAETLARAFEPFFTTKGVGHGTGLGLSTTYGFAKQSGGHVEIDSVLGEGTTVTLYLPAATSGAAAGESAAEPPEAPSRRPTEGAILVVEDEADVRQMVVATLGEMGFATREATDAPSALEILEREQDVVLILTDIMMPGMNGWELSAEARKRRPEIKILYTSGGSDLRGEIEPGLEVLRKPYRLKDLASRVGQLLAAE
jgi:signal transduction histidine kinase